MLKFNAEGFLVPSSVIKSTLKEFEFFFSVDSPDDVRKLLYNRYTDYINNLKELCGKVEIKQWVDGSYVTKKSKPSDIDLVTFIDFEIVKSKENELKRFIYPESLTYYGIDGYIVIVYPQNHKLNFIYQADCSYWINQFDKTKPNKSHRRIPKGFLEIIL